MTFCTKGHFVTWKLKSRDFVHWTFLSRDYWKAEILTIFVHWTFWSRDNWKAEILTIFVHWTFLSRDIWKQRFWPFLSIWQKQRFGPFLSTWQKQRIWQYLKQRFGQNFVLSKRSNWLVFGQKAEIFFLKSRDFDQRFGLV